MDAVKKWLLAVAIAIVFNLFVNYGLATFYPAPNYENYCNASSAYPDYGPVPAAAKPYYGGRGAVGVFNDSCPRWNPPEPLSDCTGENGYVAARHDEYGCVAEYYCERCQARFDAVRKAHDNNLFIFLVVLGVAVLAGGMLLKAESLSLGFILGGILSTIVGTARNWGQLADVARFAILGIALASLIFLGYKKLK